MLPVIPHDGLKNDLHPELVQLFGEIQRIGVLAERSQQLRPDGNDLSFHGESLNHSRTKQAPKRPARKNVVILGGGSLRGIWSAVVNFEEGRLFNPAAATILVYPTPGGAAVLATTNAVHRLAWDIQGLSLLRD